MRSPRSIPASLVASGSFLLAACSVQNIAINSIAEVLAEGTSVFAADDDPAFVERALPFSLKLIDGILVEQPDNERLLLAAASGYVLYGYAYLAVPAEQLSRDDIGRALELRARARIHFLRALAYATRALSASYIGIGTELHTEPQRAVLRIDGRGADIEKMYWVAAALGLAISSSRNEPALLARTAEVQALLDRALALDEAWGDGALHEFAVNFATVSRDDAATIDAHFDRALELSRANRASLFISYAEATALPRQDRRAFVRLLDRALAIDIDAEPDQRLVNAVAQQRARWLRSNLDELFLE